MVSVKELANILGVSSKTVYAMVEEDRIPCYRIGCGRGTLRFDVEEVKRSLKRQAPTRLEPLQRTPRKHLL
ncbi:helix-turn-helix domain-containing protein [Bremerella cremea]|nr:helix-turn-helix domain-containing protein [Bremerella cremea]